MRPDIQPRVLKVAEAMAYAGFGNATDFYAYARSGIEPPFPQPLPPRRLPARPGDTAPRYAQPEYDRLDIDAWVEARKAPLRKAEATADAVLEHVRELRSADARARRSRRRGRGGNSGPSCGESHAA